MATLTGIAVRPATEGDIPALNTLYHDVFGLTQDAAFLRWKFFANPVGTPLLHVAFEGERAVGLYALWPVWLQAGKTRALAAQSLDTMTHPDYRGKGLFSQLATVSVETAADSGVELLYGFPNPSSYPGFVRKLNWDHTGDVPTWTRPLRPSAIKRIPPALGPLRNLAMLVLPRGELPRGGVKRGRPPEAGVVALLEKRRAIKDALQFERSVEWYDWRCAPESGRNYEWLWTGSDSAMTAFCVYRVAENDELLIADVVADGEDSAESVIAAAAAEGRQRGCAVIATMTNQTDTIAALKKCGFRRTGAHPLIVRGLSRRLLGANPHDHASWRLFGLDLDVF